MKPWILFCEAHADFETASALVDRVLRERGEPWVAELLDATPDAVRVWKRDGDHEFWDLHRLDAYLREHGVRPPHGHFDGEPGAAGAAMARNVFALVRRLAQGDPM